MARIGRTMDHMELLVPLFVLGMLGLGVWFWMWLYRWATDVRDSLKRIANAADGGKPDPRTLMKPVARAKR